MKYWKKRPGICAKKCYCISWFWKIAHFYNLKALFPKPNDIFLHTVKKQIVWYLGSLKIIFLCYRHFWTCLKRIFWYLVCHGRGADFLHREQNFIFHENQPKSGISYVISNFRRKWCRKDMALIFFFQWKLRIHTLQRLKNKRSETRCRH